MKKRSLILLVAIVGVLMFSSCQRSWESLNRGVQATDRNYEIEQYSGGVLICTYKFHGMLNSSENSDGYYWYMKTDAGKILYEVSGDLKIKSWK